MIMIIRISILISVIFSPFCFSQKIIEDNNLYIFIGQKISINEFNPNIESEKITGRETDDETGDTLIVKTKSWVLDNAFSCRYLVQKEILNKLPGDTIEFNAYDHYGRPNFEKYKDVLMYISKNKEEIFFHQKYIYDPVYKINNEWVGILSFVHPNYNVEFWKKFKTININEDNSIKSKLGFCDKICQEKYYPKPYFEIKNGFVYPKKGFKIKDIVTYRKMMTFKLTNND